MPREKEKEASSVQASSAASSSEPAKDSSSQLKGVLKAAGSREDPPDDPLEERRVIKGLVQNADKNSKAGDTWFLVVLKWWKAWKLYSDYEERDDDHNAQPPGEIDNSPLLEPGADERLRMSQLEGVDYHLLPAAAWMQLHAWYGGGPGVRRKMIGVPVAIGGRLDLKLEVEVYLTTVRLYRGDAPPDEQEIELDLPRYTVGKELRKLAAQRYHLPPHRCRLQLENTESFDVVFQELLGDTNIVMTRNCSFEYKVLSGARFFVEGMDPDGEWAGLPPRPKHTNTLRAAYARGGGGWMMDGGNFGSGLPSSGGGYGLGYGYGNPAPATSPPDQIGVVGLSNLGNTCFMNAALQCLSNTGSLLEYFLQGNHSKDVNKDNPLGMKGKIAKRYCELMKDMWEGNLAYVVPKEFKFTLAKFAPQFSGFRQHDAQELLAFLLDGLHEDLNRVKKKQYVEKIEGDATTDEVKLAAEAWRGHLARNNSIIVDLFQGQLKSTLVCPVCARVSVTFDPFMYLSLPLPLPDKKTYKCAVFFKNQEPRQFEFRLKVTGKLIDLKAAIAKRTGVSVAAMQVCDISGSKVWAYLEDSKGLGTIQASDIICVYENREKKPEAKGKESDAKAGDKENKDKDKDKDKDKEKKEKEKAEKEKAEKAEKEKKERAEREKKEKEKEKSDKKNRSDKSSSISNGKSSSSGSNSQLAPASNRHGKEEKKEKKSEGRKELESSSPRQLRSSRGAEEADRSIYQIQIVMRRFGPSGAPMLFGVPSVVTINVKDKNSYTYQAIQTEVWQRIKRFIEVRAEEKGAALDLDAMDSAPPFTLCTVASPLGACTTCERQLCKGCQLAARPSYAKFKDRCVLACDFTEAMHVTFKPPPVDEKNKKGSEEAKELTLANTLNAFLRAEKLGPEDPWYCAKCKEHRQATKKFDVWSLPNVVVMHFKRFYDGGGGVREKLTINVDFPIEELNMQPYLAPNSPLTKSAQIYDLYGVVHHSGGLGGGHYTSYAKNKIDNEWYYFNDSSTSKVKNKQDMINSGAYLLFYAKRDAHKASDPEPRGN